MGLAQLFLVLLELYLLCLFGIRSQQNRANSYCNKLSIPNKIKLKLIKQPFHPTSASICSQPKKAQKQNGLRFDYSQIQNNQNKQSVISILIFVHPICIMILYFGSTTHYHPEISLPLLFLSSFKASVLHHQRGTFFLLLVRRKCAHVTEFIWDITPNCYLMICNCIYTWKSHVQKWVFVVLD